MSTLQPASSSSWLLLAAFFLFSPWTGLTFVCSQVPCPDQDTKYVRDPEDCTRYVVCVNGRAFMMPPCTASTIWSNNLRACVHSGSAHDDCNYGAEDTQTFSTHKDTDYPTTPAATPTRHVSQITTKNYWTSSVYLPTTTRSPPLPTTTAPAPPITSAPAPPEPSATPWSGQANLRGRCGIARTPYIIGGSPSSQGTWPWQVSLQVRSDVLAHRCGGVLVTSRWVLTAAHCVYGIFSAPPLYVAVIGEYNLVEHSGDEQYRGVEKIIRHPDYTAEGGYPNDIALVKLSHDIDGQFSSILPACIPYQGEEFTYQDNCFITGWGETEGHTDRRILHELPIQIRSRDYCRKVWGDTYVEHSHICVGDGDTGACQGDSGGPLVCRRRGRYYVAGLASWAVVGCRRAGYPNAFTRVSNYVTWMEETIERN